MLVVIVQLAFRVAQNGEIPANALPILGKSSLQAMFWLALGMTAARLFFLTLNAHLSIRMSTRVMTETRKALFGAFINANWPMQAKEREGELQEIMTSHVNQAAASVLVLATGIGAGLNVTALVVTAILLNWISAVAVLAVGLLLFWALRPMATYGRRFADIRRQRTTAYARGTAAAVGVAMELRIFGVDQVIQKQMGDAADAIAIPYYRYTMSSSLVPVIYQTVAMLCILLALVGLNALSPGEAGSIGATVLLLIRALSYGQAIQSAYHRHRGLVPYVESVRNAAERYRGAALPRTGKPMPVVDRFALDHVGFAYRPNEPVLVDITCNFQRGDLIGIAGPSGAGKSTLVQLLLRLREPTEGTYEINDESAALIALQAWYDHVAFVPQESRLTDASIADNIRWFRDADDDKIHAAAMQANIHDEILNFPAGYDTRVGNRGAAVSGGQRQRISLARAFLGKPDLIVFDEPTSALDVGSEHAIHRALEMVRGETTMIIIAHRLSTLRVCDRIMVLEHGRLQAFESPEVLLGSNAFYRRMSELSVTDMSGPSVSTVPASSVPNG